MELIRHPYIDWEPLRLCLCATKANSELGPKIETAFKEVFRVRAAEQLCSCTEKSFSMETKPRSKKVTVYCEWLCDACLNVLYDILRRGIPEIERVELGYPPDNEMKREFRNLDRSPWVDIGPKVVEFEDGSTRRVEPFTIARWPVSVGEFDHFTKMTGYVTQAETTGDDTFRHNPVNSQFSEAVRNHKGATCLTYYDAEAYCDWAGVRLPTEAEWIAAAVYEDTIYDRLKDRDKYMDAKGRLVGSKPNHPDKLEDIGMEWTQAGSESSEGVVRFGPIDFRFNNWNVKENVHRVSKEACDLMIGFRVAKK